MSTVQFLSMYDVSLIRISIGKTLLFIQTVSCHNRLEKWPALLRGVTQSFMPPGFTSRTISGYNIMTWVGLQILWNRNYWIEEKEKKYRGIHEARNYTELLLFIFFFFVCRIIYIRRFPARAAVANDSYVMLADGEHYIIVHAALILRV